MNIKKVISFSKEKVEVIQGENKNLGNKMRVCVCMYLLPNSSETICRIVLIFDGNIHLMRGQHVVISIWMSVCELLLDCHISLSNIKDSIYTLVGLS